MSAQPVPDRGAAADARRRDLLEEVLETFAACEDPRLRELLLGAVRHLHAFASDVRLTVDEWRAGIDFLTEVGHTTTETRHELILLSDTLGLSTLAEMLGADGAHEATENTILGPFHVPGSPHRRFGDSILEDADDGPRATVRGRVTDLAGRPLPGALLDIWQNASNRLYAVQDPGQTPTNLRGRFTAADDGAFEFRTVRPVPYPIPYDGPVGRMLSATGRHPWRPAHIHFMVSAPGHRTLVTHVFDSRSEYLDSDAVFGVRDSLIIDFVPDPAGDGLVTTFDIALEPVGAS